MSCLWLKEDMMMTIDDSSFCHTRLISLDKDFQRNRLLAGIVAAPSLSDYLSRNDDERNLFTNIVSRIEHRRRHRRRRGGAWSLERAKNQKNQREYDVQAKEKAKRQKAHRFNGKWLRNLLPPQVASSNKMDSFLRSRLLLQDRVNHRFRFFDFATSAYLPKKDRLSCYF